MVCQQDRQRIKLIKNFLKIKKVEEGEYYRNNKGSGCLVIILAVLLIVVSVFIPCFPIWAINLFKNIPIEFTLINYIYSALTCGVTMALMVVIDIARLKDKPKKNDNENSEQSN